MEVQKQNNFEDEWRKAFEDASLPPSDELWGRIETELDKKKKNRPFLFFLKPSLIATGLAAALALVLAGILFFNQETETNVAQSSTKSTQGKNTLSTTQATESVKETAISATTQETLASTDNLANAHNSSVQARIKANNIEPLASSANIASSSTNKNAIRNTARQTAVIEKPATIDNSSLAAIISDNKAKETTIAPLSNEALTSNNKTLASVESLEGKQYRYFGSRYTMNRNKLAFDAEALENIENTALASTDSKFWVGVQSGVAPFDPNMKFGQLNSLAFSSANEYAQMANSAASPGDKMSVSAPQNDIKAGLAINTGVSVGYKIAKKWHFESGVRYLRGNSTLETNTYAFQNNGYVNTFLGNYLLQNSDRGYSLVANSNTVVADASKFNNRYEYLMVPMQVGYEIGITQKFGLNILAGVSTDIFLQNSIFTDNGLVRSKNTISNDNKIYKPVNFSGLGGLRASYLISKHWQANIGTSYQRALFSGMGSSVDLNMQLQMFGINYGFNYRF